MKLYGLKVMSEHLTIQIGEPVFVNEYKYYIQETENNFVKGFKKIYKEDLALVKKVDSELIGNIGQQKLYGYFNNGLIKIDNYEIIVSDVTEILEINEEALKPSNRLELLRFIKASNIQIKKALIDNHEYYKNLFDLDFANDLLTRQISSDLGLNNININDASELLDYMEHETNVKRLIKKN